MCKLRTYSLYFLFLVLINCTKKHPQEEPAARVIAFSDTLAKNNLLIKEWLELLTHPPLSSKEGLKTNCTDISNVLTIEWSIKELECGSLLDINSNKNIAPMECLTPQLLETKIANCNQETINSFLFAVKLPPTLAPYEKLEGEKWIAKNSLLPNISIESSDEAYNNFEEPSLKEWLKTSGDNNAVKLQLLIPKEELRRSLYKTLSLLKQSSAPMNMVFATSFSSYLNSIDASPDPRLIPELKAITPVSKQVCNYLQGWIHARLALLSGKNKIKERTTYEVECIIAFEKIPNSISVTTLALPVVFTSTRKTPIFTEKDLFHPQALNSL